MRLAPLAANTSVKGDLTVESSKFQGSVESRHKFTPRVVSESGKNAHYRLRIEDTKVRT